MRKDYINGGEIVWSIEEMADYIKSELKKERYKHSLGVMETAVKLAERYHEDIIKARIAGLIHDAAKSMSDVEILDIVKSNGYSIDDVSLQNPSLLHGLVASIIAEKKMDVKDKDILNAIIYHTTGRRDMSNLEKIIYLADYIEPGRSFDGVEEMRQVAYEDLNTAMLSALNNTIKFVIQKNQYLHLSTIEARNDIMKKIIQN